MVVPVYQIYQWGIHGVDWPVDTVRYMGVYGPMWCDLLQCEPQRGP